MNLTKTGKTKITIKNFDPGRVYDTLRKRNRRWWNKYPDGTAYRDGVYDTLQEVVKQNA